MASRKSIARKAYFRWKRSYTYSLEDAYESYSSAKARAWEYCENLMKQHHGRGLKVIGANGWAFSAGFIYEEDNKPMFMYITASYDTAVEIPEEED